MLLLAETAAATGGSPWLDALARVAAPLREAFAEAHVAPGHVQLGAAAIRLTVAMALGAAIGWERERRNRPAGLRTHILVAVASALFAILALEVATGAGVEDAVDALRVDPTRVIEAVTAGVAFLAAGAIIQSRGKVRGLTTGAGMWLAGALGVACGLGQLALAALGAGIAVLVLAVLRLLE